MIYKGIYKRCLYHGKLIGCIIFMILPFYTGLSQVGTCPPNDEPSVKAMDANIQAILADPAKIGSLANEVFQNTTSSAELTAIIKRIKDSMVAQKKGINDPIKGITSSSDWARLKEIVCPYLQGKVSPVVEPTIVFKGVSYKDGSEIVVDYDNENYVYDFELKNYPQDDLYKGWEVFSEDHDELNKPSEIDVSPIAISGYPTGAGGDKLKLIAEKAYNYKIVGKYGTDKISVNFTRKKKVFEIKRLLAVDMGNEARKAKEGETLYLVRKNNELARSVEFTISTDALSKNFWPNEPIWHNYKQADRDKQLAVEAQYGQRNEEYYSKSDAGFTDKTRFRIRYRFDDWSETTTTSVSAFENERTVNVKTLTEDRVRDKATLPSAVDDALNSATKAFGEIGTWLTKVTGREVKAEIKHDFLLDRFNDQDKDTRHYYKIRQLTIGIDASISADLPIPGFNYKIPNVFEIGAYIKPGIKLRIDGGGTDRLQSETDTWEFYSFNLGGRVVGSIEAGAKANLLTKTDAVEFDFKGYAKASVSGGINYRRIPSATLQNELSFVTSIDPLVLGVSAKAKVHTALLDIQLFDYAEEWWITDRINFETDKKRF